MLHAPERYKEQWDLETLLADMVPIIKLPSTYTPQAFEEHTQEELLQALLDYAEQAYEKREVELGAETMRTLERLLLLRTIDTLWVEHLTAMEEMRQGIGLRAYGQTDPLVAYKTEAHDMWGQLLANIRRQVTHSIYHVEITQQRTPAPSRAPVTRESGGEGDAAQASGVGGGGAATAVASPAATGKRGKIGRNEPCPCGSGKKYKKCHGLAA
jgi:preprotein translocase subunit SecA